MRYVDYIWDLSPDLIIPDKDLNTEILGWEVGDYWVMVEDSSGHKLLKKLDPLVKFLKDGQIDKGEI